MIDWKKLLEKENLTDEEIQQIPSRCNFSHAANIQRYIDNGWDVHKLLENLPYTLEEMQDENIWLNPVDTLQFEINYLKNLPDFEPHYSQYFDGLKIFEEGTGIHQMLMKLMPFKQILKLSNDVTSKFHNEYRAKFISIGRGAGYFMYKPYPYKKEYLMGHECHFTRGVIDAVMSLKDFRTYSIKEILCSARLEDLFKYYYRELGNSVNEQDDLVFLNGRPIARRINLNLKEIDQELPFEQNGNAQIIRILENVEYNGYEILKEGQIFNAPYCCYRIEWQKKISFRFQRDIYALFRSGLSLRKLENQLQIAQQKTHEANQARLLLEQEIKKKDEFLSRTAHELRTPLNGIIGLVDGALSIGQGEMSSEVIDNLNTASVSSWRLSRLINDILDYSRIKENRLILYKSQVSVHQIVQSVVKNLKPLFDAKPVELTISIPDLLPDALADEIRLHQILFNLIGNALKFTQAGGVEILAEHYEDKLEICVADTGIGLPDNNVSNIFNAYEQGSDDISRRFGGTGLGLNVTKQLVELHGGRLWVESIFGEGSRFYFTIPAAQGEGSSIKSFDADLLKESQEDWMEVISSESVDNEAELPFIMAVDDEPINLRVIENHLPKNFYTIESLVTGKGLMERISKGRLPDLIILDIYMPEKSGYELCAEIRKTYLLHELPVLMLTASSNPEDMAQAFKIGANDYITKPVSKSELRARVGTHIKLKNSIKKIQHTKTKFNEISKMIDLGFLATLFIMQDRIPEGKEDEIIEHAYNYYKPVFDHQLKKSEQQSDTSSFEYFSSKFDEIKNLDTEAVLNLLKNIKSDIALSKSYDFSDENIPNLTDSVFDLISTLFISSSGNSDDLKPGFENFSEKYGLTRKESETALLIYQGFTNNDIAEQLNIKLNTVKQHVYNIFNKTGAANRTHLIFKFIEHPD